MRLKPIAVDDFCAVRSLANVTFSPAGTSACFTVSRAEKKKNCYESRLYLLKDGAVRALTGGGKESSFCYLDENTVLFAADREGEKEPSLSSRYYKIALDGGEAELAYAFPIPVSQVFPLPGGDLLVTGSTFPGFENLYTGDKKLAKAYLAERKENEDYEVVTQLPWWWNGGTYTRGAYESLFYYDAKKKSLTRLTAAGLSVSDVQLTEDRKTVYYSLLDVSVPRPAHFGGADLYRMELASRREEAVAKSRPDFNIAAYALGRSFLLLLAADGKYGMNTDADFYTLQGAIDFCATHIDLNAPKTFRMDDGIYQEIIYLRDQSNITVKGNAADNTAVNIQYDNSNDINGGIGGGVNIDQFAPVGTVVPSSGGRSVVILDGNSDKIRFENVTIENAYGWTLGKNGQAEALYINNKSAAFINCRVLSFQDTLLPGGGYNWFKDCFIAGATDFIWGSGKVVLFEDCQLHAPTGTRAVMQARVRAGYLGYVFLNSRFTVGAGITSSTLIYQYEPDNLTFLNCTFADVYGANFVGENKPLTPAVPTVATGCKLYNCKTESGVNLYESIPAAVRNTVLQLSDEQYNQYFGTRKTIMSWDGYADADWFK